MARGGVSSCGCTWGLKDGRAKFSPPVHRFSQTHPRPHSHARPFRPIPRTLTREGPG